MSLRLSFYGDDFTGSTDVLEALSLAGLKTMLFLEPPKREQLAAHPDLGALGVAGTSRSWTPERMRAELPGIFEKLRALGAATTLYKICSTFDSSPELGSIGVALELGRATFGPSPVPLLAAAPRLGRYCLFGHLFARAGAAGVVHRLDRHPTMRHHPSTPMTESDLRLHLAAQTPLETALLDVLAYAGPQADLERRFAELAANAEVVLLDALEDAHLSRLGPLLARSPFVVGSSGVAQALTLHWNAAGELEPQPLPPLEPAERLLVVSGSCSPVSAAQLREAERDGFHLVALEPARLLGEAGALEAEHALTEALAALAAGRSVALHTCLGPDDPRTPRLRRAFAALGLDPRLESGPQLGTALGGVLRSILGAEPVRRVVVAGGDTSGYAARALGLAALSFHAPLAPGAPLCRATADGRLNGLEIVFKGGQTGPPDIYRRALRGPEKTA